MNKLKSQDNVVHGGPLLEELEGTQTKEDVASLDNWQAEVDTIQTNLNSSEDCAVGTLVSENSLNEQPTRLVAFSDDSDSMLVDAIPSLEEQRVIVNKLWEEFVKASTEGDKMYIVPSQWSTKFLDQNQTDYTALGQMDIKSVVLDRANLILAPFDLNPYIAVPEPVFNRWYEWYGVTEGSFPFYTVLVKDAGGQLIVEYDRPKFMVHYLTINEDTQNYKCNAQVPIFFTMSRLSTMEDVVTRAMKLFCERESSVDIDVTNFRTWYIKDKPSASENVNDYLTTNYKIKPSTFVEFPMKHLIKSEQLSYSIKDYDSETIDLAVELKPPAKNQHWASNYYIYNQMTPSNGTVGLGNLGNTCYMNSALQCLVHIPEFKDYFLYNAYEKEINVDNPLGHKGHIAWAFGTLIQSLFGKRNNLISSYSPRHFKTTIGHLNSMFAGYQQQDSQEFLAFLLDGLHEDLNRIVDKPYVEKPELNPTDDVTEFETIKKLADDTWLKHKLRNDSVILDLFVGLYKSTLICPTCKKVSTTFDPYNDLTLPLPVDSTWSNKVLIFPHSSPPYTFEVELNKTDTYCDLKKYVARCTGMNTADLLGAEVFNHQFYNNYEASRADSQYLPIHELISDSDVVVFYEVPRSENDLVVPVMNTVIEDGFRSAKLCGFPFFISLSEEEQSDYGVILQKLENAFIQWSGGFTEFTLASKKNDTITLDQLPVLQKKYPGLQPEAVATELKYINPEQPPEKFFKIKIYDGQINNQRSRFASQPYPRSARNDLWTPEPHVTFSKVKDITANLDQVLWDAYNYASIGLEGSVENPNIEYSGCNNFCESEDASILNVTSQNIGPHTQSSDSDMDIEVSIDNQDLQKAESSEEHSLDLVADTLNDIPREKLIKAQNAIICEWNSKSYDEVFNSSLKVNWDSPGEVPNTELEASKRERNAQEEKKITLHDCLTLFSTPEVLGATDSWYCPSCKEHRQATKQIELWNTPDILLIHLKRFENQRSFSDKIGDIVHFPITDLDMSPYLVYKDDKKGTIYDLIAVDNHYGGLGGGHYTAYVKNFLDNKWYYFDDSRVNETVPERSIAGSAYLLFYRRRTESNYVGSQYLCDIINKSRQKYDERMKQFNDAVLDLYTESRSDNEDESEHNQEQSLEDEETEDEDKRETVHLLTLADGRVDQRGSIPIKGMISPNSDYSIASLEVGDGSRVSGNDEDNHNNSRRKLRLLQKTYNSQSSDIASPESTPCSSTGSISDENTENTKIGPTRNESIPDSPSVS
ncbi:putative ubiquitin-specific protease UBP12 Ecym_8140 [Eremothecium cymbalariae DBVPG|uniref:ubiquitinyl hydrolase 1 n=1 Tax=Eremothecium cymbalariae (strain CBS 270.75 / DBVPG 7215 / KCTC 17166 / NRRL Y-17582) TaxID=931890 RepID=G8JX57_ERECY|nr:Hypothetical protein Ecym_8140 [Eremothecium cymbalariae DBVPG\